MGLSPVSQEGLSVFLGFLMGFSVKSNVVGDHWMRFWWGWLKVSGVTLKGSAFNGDVTGGRS